MAAWQSKTRYKAKSRFTQERVKSRLQSFDDILLGYPFLYKRQIIKIYKLQKQWPGLVGDMMAKRSQPVRIKKKVLIIAVENQAWGQQFAMMKLNLLDSLKKTLGFDFEDIRFVAEPLRLKREFQESDQARDKKQAFKTSKKDDARLLQDILRDIGQKNFDTKNRKVKI